MWWKLGRFPLAALTYLLTQTSTRPVRRLAEKMREAGYNEVREERFEGWELVVYSGRRKGGER